MKITKSQLRQIIREANADGTISPDEDTQFESLMDDALNQVSELFRELFHSADMIGGPFRGPGMKLQLRKLIQRELERAANYNYHKD